MIFTQASDVINYNDTAISMESEMIEDFNSKFEIFEGEIRGTQLRSLINQVIANNSIEKNNIELSGVENIVHSSKYLVELEYNYQDKNMIFIK